MPPQLGRVMLVDIHGVATTQFKANLGEHPSHGGSRKKRKKDSADNGRVSDSDMGDDGLELYHDASAEHLDIQA
jgi:hypothetical protein